MFFLEKLSLLLPWKRGRRESSFEEELRSHLEFAAEEALKSGATEEEAKFAARRDLGNQLRIQEDTRTIWGFAVWDQFKRDCAYSMRILRRSPSFTFMALVSLAVGIGAATAIFSLVNTVLLKPLSYHQPDRLVVTREVVAPLAGTYPSLPVNYQHFLFWREHVRSLESIAAVQGGASILTGNMPMKVGTAYVSTNLFAVLGVQPQIGRSFLSEEERKGHDHVAILTDSLWSSSFGRSPDVLGQLIRLDYQPYTVIGVLPRGFRFPRNDELGPLAGLSKETSVFLPLTGSYSNGWGGDYDYAVIGRLRPNTSLTQADAELDLLEHQIDSEHHLGEGLRVVSSPLQNVIATPVRAPLYALMAAVMLLLLIVCVNLANLVLARSSVRLREFSIRVALGAGQTGLIRQIVIETCLLGIGGGALGFGLAGLALRAFTANASVQIPRLDELHLDARVFVFLLVISVGCGLLSGLLPAVRLTSTDTHESLRSSTHTVAGNRQSLRIREILIACEVAMSVILLFGAGLMTTSIGHVLDVDKGFTVQQALAINVELPDTHYKTGQEDLRFWDHTLIALRTIPGVESAAFASKLPLTGESMVNDVVLDGADRSALDPASKTDILVNVRFVSPDYFATLGIPVLQGRSIQAADRNRAVAVVSTRLAAKLWPGQNPVGKKLTTGSDLGKVEIVGVVKDVHATTLDREPTLIIYAPYWRRGLSYGSLVMRTATDPANLIPAIREQLHEIDPSLPVPEMVTIGRLVTNSLSRRYFQVRLAGGFALAALALAVIGIYGVVVYHGSVRRTEVAVRLAVGASRTDVFRLFVQSGFRPVLAGLVMGLVAAIGCGHLIRGLLFGIKANDPLTTLTVIALLAVTAFLACLIPARRASRTDPATALRYE